MLLFATIYSWIKGCGQFAGMVLLVLCLGPPLVQAQDEDPFASSSDDSLLFGEEFDLGTDDFSFDLNDATPADSSAGEADDFFGESESDSESADDTTAAEDDWGLGDDAEFGEDSTASDTLLEEYPDHPLDFRRKYQGTALEGTGLVVSFYSPQYVADNMDTWYSYLDYSLSFELPWHYTFDPARVSFLVDVASFNFKNSFPAGGTFAGVSVMPAIRAEVFGLEAEAGLGMYYPTFGVMAGLGYSYQFHSIFISAGYRWNWAYQIDPIGSGWWLEPRFTTGIKLW